MRMALRNSARASSRSRRVVRSLKNTPRALARTNSPARFIDGIGCGVRSRPHISAAKAVANTAKATAKKPRRFDGAAAAGTDAGAAIQRYPRPRIVSMNFGERESSSNAWRSAYTATITASSVTNLPSQTSAISRSRLSVSSGCSVK